MMKNKGQGISINTIIVAAIALLVLVVISVVFINKLVKIENDECDLNCTEFNHRDHRFCEVEEVCICREYGGCYWKNTSEYDKEMEEEYDKNLIFSIRENVNNCDFIFIMLNMTDEQVQGFIWGMVWLTQIEHPDDILKGENGGYVIVMPKGCKYENMTKEYKTINDIPTESDCIDEDNCWIKIE